MSSLPASVLSSLTQLDERSRLYEYQDKYTKCSRGLPCLGHGRLPPQSTDGQWGPVLQFNTIEKVAQNRIIKYDSKVQSQNSTDGMETRLHGLSWPSRSLIKSFACWVLCDGTMFTKHYHFPSQIEMHGKATEI